MKNAITEAYDDGSLVTAPSSPTIGPSSIDCSPALRSPTGTATSSLRSAGPEQVLAYLATYTHRLAISNHRITAFHGERVHVPVSRLPRRRYPQVHGVPGYGAPSSLPPARRPEALHPHPLLRLPRQSRPLGQHRKGPLSHRSCCPLQRGSLRIQPPSPSTVRRSAVLPLPTLAVRYFHHVGSWLRQLNSFPHPGRPSSHALRSPTCVLARHDHRVGGCGNRVL